ncbi:MAG TPA: peptidase M28, partial [Ferruginibacter sp.]|nr:peptidase M28 [Ferruginibacter sp.]
MRKYLLPAIALCLASTHSLAQNETEKIKQEGLKNSQVMNIAFHLTDESGPRLTNSPGFLRAANWAKDELTRMGLVNATLEPWGDFGKGWEQTRCYVAMTAPYYVPMIAIPRAWTGSTPGKKMINSDVILIKAKDSAELYQKYAGTLKGKIVMLYSRDTLKPSFEPDGVRFSHEALDKMANAKPDTTRRVLTGRRPQGLAA